MFTDLFEARGLDTLAVYEQFAKAQGLTVAQLRVLAAVWQNDGCTQTSLCAGLQVSKQRLHLLVNELAQKALLVKEKNKNDGRSALLRLTPAGKTLVKAFMFFAAQSRYVVPHAHAGEDGAVTVHTHGGHGQTHTHQNTKAVLDRLSRAIGHLEKVRQMVESGADCSEVLIQLSAVKAAVNNTGKLILKDHIAHCLVDAVEHGDYETVENLNAAIDRFIE